MRDELSESFTLLPRCSEQWIWITKPSESPVKKFIRRGSIPAGALSVKGPAKNELCRTIVFSSHSAKPMVYKHRFPDTGPGNDCNDVGLLVCPCIVQKGDVLLSTKNIAAGNGQSGYGDFLRSKSSWRSAGSDRQSAG